MDKPLHVRVAEALGCTSKPLSNGEWFCECASRRDVDECPATGYGTGGTIPRYDTSWEATGPLIERTGIAVMPWSLHPSPERRWHACLEGGEACESRHAPIAYGETPLIAVCNLILAIAAAGKFRAEATLSPPSP